MIEQDHETDFTKQIKYNITFYDNYINKNLTIEFKNDT